MRLIVCLMASGLIVSSVARGNPPDQKCPDQKCPDQKCPNASAAQSDPAGASGNLFARFCEAVSCPESSSKCQCAKTADKVVVETTAHHHANAGAAGDEALPCCSKKASGAACADAQAKCCAQAKVATSCSEEQAKFCKQATVAAGAETCADSCREGACSTLAAAGECCSSDAQCCLESEGHCPHSACSTNDKIAHLIEAAQHLQAVGMNCEADRIHEVVQTLRGELLAEKVAQLERLQGEISELRRVAGRQVLLRVKVVELSLTELHKLGFIVPFDANCPSSAGVPQASDKPNPERASFSTHVYEGAGVNGFFDALSQAKIAKVLAVPTLVTVDGRPATLIIEGGAQVPVVEAGGRVRMQAREVGARVDFEPQLLGQNRIRLHVHPRVTTVDPSLACQADGGTCPGVRVVEVDTHCEMDLGKTMVIAGPLQRRVVNSCAEANECDASETCEVQTVFLITPELVPAGHPFGHTARQPALETSPVR